jgi:hypothetical protein
VRNFEWKKKFPPENFFTKSEKKFFIQKSL